MGGRRAEPATPLAKRGGRSKDLDVRSFHPGQVSGTTAVCALMRGDTMWVANAGDSRAIVARRDPKGKLVTHDLTQDQKPDTPQEKERIERMGGRVSPAAADGTPVARAP